MGSGSNTAVSYTGQAEATAKILCPNCGNNRPRRLERKGFLQEKVYPWFGYFPWVCRACKATFLVRKRNRKKSKAKEYAV